MALSQLIEGIIQTKVQYKDSDGEYQAGNKYTGTYWVDSANISSYQFSIGQTWTDANNFGASNNAIITKIQITPVVNNRKIEITANDYDNDNDSNGNSSSSQSTKESDKVKKEFSVHEIPVKPEWFGARQATNKDIGKEPIKTYQVDAGVVYIYHYYPKIDFSSAGDKKELATSTNDFIYLNSKPVVIEESYDGDKVTKKKIKYVYLDKDGVEQTEEIANLPIQGDDTLKTGNAELGTLSSKAVKNLQIPKIFLRQYKILFYKKVEVSKVAGFVGISGRFGDGMRPYAKGAGSMGGSGNNANLTDGDSKGGKWKAVSQTVSLHIQKEILNNDTGQYRMVEYAKIERVMHEAPDGLFWKYPTDKDGNDIQWDW